MHAATRRQTVVARVLSLATALILVTPAAAQPTDAGPTDCAMTGWPSSVSSHLDVVRHALNAPAPTTVGGLASLAPPVDVSSAIPVVLRVEADVLDTQVKPDGTIEIALADPVDPSQTMSATLLSSACLASADQVLATQLDGARNALYAACGVPTPTPQSCTARVSVVGVGIFNSGNPPALDGESANGLELRPVLGLQPSTSAAGALPSAAGAPGAPGAAGGGLGKSLSGNGPQDTLPFQLDAGAYTISWSASTAGVGPVNFAGFVKPVDPALPQWILVANAIVRPGENQSGMAQSPRMPGGAYYLTVIGDASWTVTVAPVRASGSTAAMPVSVTNAPGQPASSEGPPTLVPPAVGTGQPRLVGQPRSTTRPTPTPRPRPIPRPRATPRPRPTPTPLSLQP